VAYPSVIEPETRIVVDDDAIEVVSLLPGVGRVAAVVVRGSVVVHAVSNETRSKPVMSRRFRKSLITKPAIDVVTSFLDLVAGA
jgi:hypothetical protein